MAAAETGIAASPRVFARGLGRFRRHGSVDVRAGRRLRRHHLRLAHQGGETAAPLSLVSAETDLLGESPLGDGARRKIIEEGTGSPCQKPAPRRSRLGSELMLPSRVRLARAGSASGLSGRDYPK